MGLKDLINKLRKQKLEEDIAAAEAANVLPAPTPSTTVTPQQALNRTVAAIKKVKELSLSKAEMANIIDLTGKTQAEAFTALYGTGDNNITMFYTNPGNGYGFLGWVVSKHADNVTGSGFWLGRGNGQISMRAFGIHKDATTPLNDGNSWLSDPAVNEEFDATTKKYVDAGLAAKANADLKVIYYSGTQVNISEMNGTSSSHLLASQNYVDNFLGLKANGNLKVHDSTGHDVNIATMDGTTDDKKIPTVKYVDNALGAKQATLTRTLTLVLDDNTTTDIKVG